MLKNIIICGDFNAHSLLWGDKPANKAGKLIERLISNNVDLAIATPPNLNTYFNPKSGKFSTIDLQIVSINILNKIYIKKIENLCTDHFAIVSSLNEPANILPHIPKYVNTKANWTMFKNKLNDEILSFTQNSHTSVATADTHAEVMTSILTNTANQAIPRTSPKKTIPNKPLKLGGLKIAKLCEE